MDYFFDCFGNCFGFDKVMCFCFYESYILEDSVKYILVVDMQEEFDWYVYFEMFGCKIYLGWFFLLFDLFEFIIVLVEVFDGLFL